MKKTIALILLLSGLSMAARSETLTWKGSEGHMTWNTEDKNWLQGDTPANYADSYAVEFGDIGYGEVSLAGTLAPASVLVNNSSNHDYTFSGNGQLTGTMQLTKNGSGTLTVNTANEYTGGTMIANGKVVVGSDNALGSGTITLGNETTLNLGNHSLSNVVTTEGNASIGSGSLNGNLTMCSDKTLNLTGNLDGTGTILIDTCIINLNEYTLSNNVVVNSWLSIGNGTLNGNLTMNGTSRQLFLGDDLGGTGTITMEGSAALVLHGHTLSNNVALKGSASISSGTLNGNLDVDAGTKLSMEGDLNGTGTITLGDNATLNLGTYTLSNSVALKGSATIGRGSLASDLSVKSGEKLALYNDLDGTGTITLGDNATLDLSRYALSNSVTLQGTASITEGTLNGNLSVGEDKTLTLIGDLAGTGTITLGSRARLLMGGHSLDCSVTLQGTASITEGTLNGNLSVGEDKTLTLIGDLDGEGTITLGEKATLNLNKHILSHSVTITGNIASYITEGTFNGDITVGADKTLHLIGSQFSGEGTITLGDKATLYFRETTLSHSVILNGSAFLSGGTLNGKLTVGAGKTATLQERDLNGTGVIILGDNATLNLNTCSVSNAITLAGPATIGNGTINGSVTLGEGAQAHFSGETRIKYGTITAGATTIKALRAIPPGLLQELSVTDGLIAGTNRQSSLADGLNIESTASLMIKSMTITADNKISVGENTITLNNVTIKLSQTTYELVEGVYYFKLSDLFHCSVDMTDVTFDASELTLPKGFDPETNGIAFNLGDATLTRETATRNISLLLGGYGSQTMEIDTQGRPVFTHLVPIPEPTTGTLGLLALAALAARRRKG